MYTFGLSVLVWLVVRVWYTNEIPVPEQGLWLANAPEPHVIEAVVRAESGNAMRHGVQIAQNGLAEEPLQARQPCKTLRM
jgi:hypothetical protein